MKPVVVFSFAGRRPNLELQLPLLRRVLDEHPEVEFHIWNLTMTPEDDEYVRAISGDRISVHNEFHGENPWLRFNDVWRHYTADEYADTTFVKIDDDVVFLETERFSDLIDAVKGNPGSVISAETINNGASTRTIPGLWEAFQGLNMDLLDVHLSGDYAELSHDHALDNWDTLIGQPLTLIPTDDWLSINLIGFDHQMVCRIADGLGGRSPQHIAGRLFRKFAKLGDEGSVNRFPRLIQKGFLAAHLTFGPQRLPEDVWDDFRARYAEVGTNYLRRQPCLSRTTDTRSGSTSTEENRMASAARSS